MLYKSAAYLQTTMRVMRSTLHDKLLLLFQRRQRSSMLWYETPAIFKPARTLQSLHASTNPCANYHACCVHKYG